MKAKFKVGDRVKILDGAAITNYVHGWGFSMSRYIGKITTIIGINDYGNRKGYRLKEDNGYFTWDERGLAPVKPETIIIYRKDNEVIALDKTTGEKGVARCSPKDEFDFMTGAKLAFERLTTPKEEKPVYFTGKVVCIDSKYPTVLTRGKIYEFKDGYSTDDNGNRMPALSDPILNADDMNARFDSDFIEIVE